MFPRRTGWYTPSEDVVISNKPVTIPPSRSDRIRSALCQASEMAEALRTLGLDSSAEKLEGIVSQIRRDI